MCEVGKERNGDWRKFENIEKRKSRRRWEKRDVKNVGKETSGITHPVVVAASDKVIHQPDSAVLPFVCSSLLELTELIGLTNMCR